IANPTGENGIVRHHETRKLNKILPLPVNFKEDDLSPGMNFTVKGNKKVNETIFLRIRIADKEELLSCFVGHIRIIYFTFDVEGDTIMCVASEM
ncbi:hypothetical protein KI387_032384, partial [Taxus chinensis]